ncbi:MAG: hypothetical protein Q9210_001216 [Variospora velana]
MEEQSQNITDNPSMALAPNEIPPSPMESAPESTSPSQYTDLGPVPSQQPMSRASTSHAAARRRRSSKGAMMSSIKRSASTPNVRGVVTGESSMSLTDKRRNKLGYHRHCRRRKIRCLLALDDPQNRCSNCIRLKKECCFFPVDQQPQMSQRPRTGSKAGSGDTSISSSSSPALAGGPLIDHYSQFRPLPLSSQDYPPSAAPLSATTSSPSRRSTSLPLILDPKSLADLDLASDNSRTYEFSYHADRSYWESPFYEQGPISAGHSTPEEPSHAYWRMGDSPITPAFSQIPGPPSSLMQPRSSFAAFSPPREDHGWQSAPRSMSFGHVEDLSHGYPNPYLSPVSMDYRRRPSDLYPPSLQTSSESSKNNSTGDISTPPLTATVNSQSMGHFVSPIWNALPGHSSLNKTVEYNPWYSDPAPLAKVTEEEVGPPFNGGSGHIFTSVG